jgi:transcriptional regulator with GAF, ATPase, and Fis domain
MPSLQLQTPTRQLYPLTQPLTSIGSASDNNVVVQAVGVDAHHALIRFDGATFELQTLQRGQEVAINGKRTKKAVLRHNDRVEIGACRFVFQLLDECAAGLNADELEGLNFELDGLRKLQALSARLLGEYEQEALLEGLMDAVISITGADKGFLVMADEPSSWSIRVARNIQQETIRDAVAHISDSILSHVIQSKRAIIVSDALSHEEFRRAESVVNLKLSSVMCAPLVDRGELLGAIYVGSASAINLFEPRHLSMLTVFAAQASLLLKNAKLVQGLKADKRRLERRIEDMRYGTLIGACDAMREVFYGIDRVAPTTVNVLITGETGTGKELVAREIHNRSPRAKGPFVALNCGAIAESLLESELFGHVKGSFTGATHTREGKFQAADGGTIFLDEIGEMPLNLQVKLLRVLQERMVTKVGATQAEPVNIRIVAATNRDLEEAVRQGSFREDLYYRLNVVPIKLPPLRLRGEDVVMIGRYLIHKISDELGVAPKEFSAAALVALKRYEWPGNIRQLENRLKKALVLSDGPELTPADLDLPQEVLQAPLPLAEAKEQFAYRYIMEALERNGGNRTQTARELGVDPRTIFRYLERDEG